jgi:hypothetical protein
MAERVSDEITIVIHVDTSEAKAQLTELNDLAATTPAASENNRGSDFGLGLGNALRSLVQRQVMSLFRQGLSLLFGGRGRTTTTTTVSSRGGDSQFSPPSATSVSQSSASLAKIVARGERNS